MPAEPAVTRYMAGGSTRRELHAQPLTMLVLDKLTNAIQKRASLATVTALGALYALFAGALNFWGAELERRCGGPVLDLRRSFTAEEAYAVLGAYGPDGRRLYFALELVDVVYPLVYTAFFALAIAYVLKRSLPPASALHKLALLPLSSVVADYLENVGILTMCATYPEPWPRLGDAAGVFNAIKWLTAAACIAVTVLGLVGWLIKTLLRFRRA